MRLIVTPSPLALANSTISYGLSKVRLGRGDRKEHIYSMLLAELNGLCGSVKVATVSSKPVIEFRVERVQAYVDEKHAQTLQPNHFFLREAYPVGRDRYQVSFRLQRLDYFKEMRVQERFTTEDDA